MVFIILSLTDLKKNVAVCEVVINGDGEFRNKASQLSLQGL